MTLLSVVRLKSKYGGIKSLHEGKMRFARVTIAVLKQHLGFYSYLIVVPIPSNSCKLF